MELRLCRFQILPSLFTREKKNGLISNDPTNLEFVMCVWRKLARAVSVQEPWSAACLLCCCVNEVESCKQNHVYQRRWRLKERDLINERVCAGCAVLCYVTG